jgi:hypothetical protein
MCKIGKTLQKQRGTLQQTMEKLCSKKFRGITGKFLIEKKNFERKEKIFERKGENFKRYNLNF